MENVRLPRFQRASEIQPIQLTDRDRAIVQRVHQHRFLRSSHIWELCGESRQGTLRRLHRLFHHGYLERPRAQIDYYRQGGSRPIVYGLGNKGAALLKRELSLPFHRLDWPQKNKIARLFLEHALMISDVMVALELACRNSGARLLTEDELNFSERKPFQWKIQLSRNQTCGVIPDQVFGLEFPGKPAVWFCLEADRGTMPVVRRDFSKSSFQRKLLAYEATWKQKLHHKIFDCPRFRVLTVTNSADRLATMLDTCHSLERGHGLFLFTNAADLNTKDFFASRWQNCRGEFVALLD